jgi:hypothetical protein
LPDGESEKFFERELDRHVADLPVGQSASGRYRLDHPGSMPFALITASADGAARNLMKALAASASLLELDVTAEK